MDDTEKEIIKKITSSFEKNDLLEEDKTPESEPIKVNYLEEKVDSKSGNFDTVVLSGGSVQGLIMLGALQYAKDNYLLTDVNTYVGCSIGSILCYLLAIGYTPMEIMVYICTHQILEKMRFFDIVDMVSGKGAVTFSHISEQLEMMTIEKIGRLITLKELYTRYNKKLICVTHNMTTNKTENLSYETYPDMPCLIAIRMSSNLPFVFEHFKYLGNFYIDGGLSNNFPIDIGKNVGKKVFGLVLTLKDGTFNGVDENMLDYIYKLIAIPMEQTTEYKISTAAEHCTIIRLKADVTKFFDFNVDSHNKLEMFSNGYTQIKKHFET